jgi:hypothetical protein
MILEFSSFFFLLVVLLMTQCNVQLTACVILTKVMLKHNVSNKVVILISET